MNKRYKTCPRCEGTGEEDPGIAQELLSALVWNVKSPCSTCRGKGELLSEEED